MPDPLPEENDPVDLASRESFPASDPPAWIFRPKDAGAKDTVKNPGSPEKTGTDGRPTTEPPPAVPGDA
jgi:hypothetical protein